MQDLYINQYTRFRELKNFELAPLKSQDNCIYFNNELVQNGNSIFAEGDQFINVSFGFSDGVAGILSNLFPLEFIFRGRKVASIEGVLQGIKYIEVPVQNEVLKYSGMTAYTAGKIVDWTKTQKLYWQGSEMERESNEYQLFLDELYLSALDNPLYRKALLSTGNKTILYNGSSNPKECVITRTEYETRLNTLRDFLRSKMPSSQPQPEQSL